MDKFQKPLVEDLYKEELEILLKNDKYNKPQNWKLSPQAIRDFILGNDNLNIKKKFYGDDSLVERSIITLASNRGLMLIGEPGTAKTMLSELLSAGISGISTNTIQGTAGINEDNIKYINISNMLIFINSPYKKTSYQSRRNFILYSLPFYFL